MKPEAWANTLAERLAEVKAETIGQTLTAVKGASLVKNWPPRLQRRRPRQLTKQSATLRLNNWLTRLLTLY